MVADFRTSFIICQHKIKLVLKSATIALFLGFDIIMSDLGFVQVNCKTAWKCQVFECYFMLCVSVFVCVCVHL